MTIKNIWVPDSDIEMRMRTNRKVTKAFVEGPNVKMFALPRRDRPVLYVPDRAGGLV